MQKIILVILLTNCIKIVSNIKPLNKNINEALVAASKTGNVEEVKILLDKGADTNYRDDNNRWPPLIYASRNGHIEVVKLLLEKDTNIDAKDGDGETSLTKASKEGYIEIVKLLIEKGADINSADNFGYTTLMKTSSRGKLEIVKMLIENGANVNSKNAWAVTALMGASREGYIEIVKVLIEKGANINARDIHYDTALIEAAGKGHVEVVKFLLDNKANPRYVGYQSRTALGYAIEEMKRNTKNKYNYVKVVNMLLKEKRIEYILIRELVTKNNVNNEKKLTYTQEESLKCLQEHLCILESLLKLPIEILGEVIKYL